MSVRIVAIIPNEKNQNAGRSDKKIWLREDGLQGEKGMHTHLEDF